MWKSVANSKNTMRQKLVFVLVTLIAIWMALSMIVSMKMKVSDPLIIDAVIKKEKLTFDFGIVIPFVKRDNNAFYLNKTVTSLVEHVSSNYTLVILLYCGQIDEIEWCSNIFDEGLVESKSNIEISTIIADKSQYPSFENLPRKYGDSVVRTKWRSKQCIDYSEMLRVFDERFWIKYGVIQWEDDFILLKNNQYLDDVKHVIDKVEEKDKFWYLLPLNIGGHNIIYNPQEIQKISRLYRDYFWEQPVDWLHGHLINMRPLSNFKTIKAKFINTDNNNYYQHTGDFSSLPGKMWKGLKNLKNP